MMHRTESPLMTPKSLTQIVAGTNTVQNVDEYGSKLNQDVTQPHPFSDANQWVKAEPATSTNFENVPSPSYMTLPNRTAAVLAVPVVGNPTFFSQFFNPNLSSWFLTTATPTPAIGNP